MILIIIGIIGYSLRDTIVSYNKIKKNHATLEIKGSQSIFFGKPSSEILLKNINYTEDKNTIEI